MNIFEAIHSNRTKTELINPLSKLQVLIYAHTPSPINSGNRKTTSSLSIKILAPSVTFVCSDGNVLFMPKMLYSPV